MSTTMDRPSATIYQFPIGGRAALGRKRDERTTSDYLASLGTSVAVGGSWYHEEAIEAERSRNN